MKKKYFDAASLPQDAVKLNKPNLRQFVVFKSYYKDLLIRDECVFTSDSLREAVKIAHKLLNDEVYSFVQVYEADGVTKVCKFDPSDFMRLYKIREYLK